MKNVNCSYNATTISTLRENDFGGMDTSLITDWLGQNKTKYSNPTNQQKSVKLNEESETKWQFRLNLQDSEGV